MKIYHNEMDHQLIVCSNCEDSINEGIYDDRLYFHSPSITTDIVVCDLCWSDGTEL